MLGADTWGAHDAIRCNCVKGGSLEMLRIFFNPIGDVSTQVFLSGKAVEVGNAPLERMLSLLLGITL